MANHVQNHIHLSDTLGSAPENAPNKTFPVHDRKPIPTVFMNPRRSKTGKLFPNRLLTSGIPVKIMNYQYQIRVSAATPELTQDLLDLIFAWHGKLVYLVDNYHPNDGSDHTPALQTVLLTVAPLKTDDWGLFRYYVDIITESDEL